MILQEYYNSLTFVALDELLKEHSQEKIEKLLSTFKCIKNPDLEESEPNIILLDKNSSEPNVKMYYPLV